MVFISVHVGAGFHKSEDKYRKSLIESTNEAKKILNNGGTALDACARAVEILENDGITNCGRGSALNLNCEVQCDASLMQSIDLNWAGVGSISNVKNPIIAAKLLLHSQQKKHPDGLINPCFLVGEGAKRWALQHGCLESNDLVTDQAIDLFEKHRFEITKLKEQTISSTINEQFIPIKKRKRGESTSSVGDLILREHGYTNSDVDSYKSKEKILDTVGAVAIDKYGNVASAVSSGGIMFKDEGRIGQAAVYGSGCWAEDNVAVTTTGVGEYLVKTMFAKKCASKLLKASEKTFNNKFGNFAFDDVLKSTFINHFLNSKYLKATDHDKLIGVLSLVCSPKDAMVQLIWAHNTPAMFLAYSTGDRDAEIVFSRTTSETTNTVEARSLLINY